MEESEDPIAEGNGLLLIIKNKTNKNNPIGEKTDWQAGQGRAQDIDDPTYGNEPSRNCKHKEILKGANEEGNEGKQLGTINQ